jgi:ketosteroid isomerase-like protein
MRAHESQNVGSRSEALSRNMITPRHRRRSLLRAGMLSTAAGLAGLVFPSASPAGAQASDPEGAKIGAIYQLQAAFHQAKSHQDIDLMMSLWASDATFSLGDSVLSGADAIRTFFLGSGSWTHARMSFVPSFKDQIQVEGDEAYLYFECHDVALTDESAAAPSGTIVTHLTNFGTIRKVEGNWVFQAMHSGMASPLSIDTIYNT